MQRTILFPSLIFYVVVVSRDEGQKFSAETCRVSDEYMKYQSIYSIVFIW